VRNAQIQIEVEKEFARDKTLKNRDLAYLYVMRLNEMDRATDDISREILNRNSLKSVALKSGTVGGAALLGLAASLPVVNVLAGLLAVPTFISARWIKSAPISEKNRPMVQRMAVRAFAANALALGGSMVAAPLAIALGALGIFSPEIWKHRKYLYEKGGKGGKLAWEKGIKPGVPLVAKGAWGVFKWTVGLPFTLAFKAGQKIAK